MSRLIWLASYPKSGNTWFRLLLAALRTGLPARINDLSSYGGHAANREMFDALTLLESGLLTEAETDALRPAVYQAVARGDFPKARALADFSILKIHDAYRVGADGRAMFAAAKAAILIVRDPRDVASALASAGGCTLDAAIDTMSDENYAVSRGGDHQTFQLSQRLNSWHGHTQSWLGQVDIPVLTLRYEDMQHDAARALASAAAFVGAPIDAATACAAAAGADFRAAQEQERTSGFIERAPEAAGPFFRRGQAGGWRDELTDAQARLLELRHGEMMRKLGYAPAATSAG
jgi:hypothetical protein